MLAGLLIVACSGTGEKKTKLAFVTNNASDYWTIARKGVEKADSELPNVDVEFRMPADGTAAEQKRIMEDLLAKGIAGMAISPVDPDNQTQLINETAKQALVVTQDSDAPQSARAFYIGTDNRAAGRQAGDLIKEALPQGGKIMLFVGKIDARNAQERYQGIKDALQGSKVEIIDVRTDDTDRIRAKSNASDTIVKYSDVAALIGLWSYNGPAILNAVKDAGKVGQIKIVCFDEEDRHRARAIVLLKDLSVGCVVRVSRIEINERPPGGIVQRPARDVVQLHRVNVLVIFAADTRRHRLHQHVITSRMPRLKVVSMHPDDVRAFFEGLAQVCSISKCAVWTVGAQNVQPANRFDRI